jgi:hypothetical protein
MKRNDLLPEIQGVCEDANGPVDLTTASSVKFLMGLPGVTTNKVSAAATFVDRPNGVVKYSWVSGDTDTAGEYEGEFEVMWPGTKPETFPNRGKIKIVIEADRG